MSYRSGLAVGLSLFALLFGSVSQAAAPPLVSHRAVYSLKLARASSNAAVNAASGQLVVEWQDTCDGYTTNQRFLTEFSDTEGRATTTDLWVSSWEARNGDVFRFNLTNSTNGAIQERSRGLAKRGGQKAEVTFDTFPGIVVTGHVDSIAPASGSQFSLLPPDNATGNFTKVVQRIPVKILLDRGGPLAGRLRPGMSAVATILTDTRAAQP